MKRFFAYFLALAMALSLLAGCGNKDVVPAETAVAQGQETTGAVASQRVATMDDFLASIAPGADIWLEAGTYNLSDASNYGQDSGSPYYSWQSLYDGDYALVIHGVDGLSIRGSGADATTLVTEPRYANVLTLQNCTNLVLGDFTAGHTDGGECSGGVIRLAGCIGVDMNRLGLFGCGTVGVQVDTCTRVSLTDSEIYECSSSGVSVNSSQDVTVLNCKLRDLGSKAFGGYAVFDVNSSGKIKITGCEVTDCKTSYIFSVTQCREVEARDNQFRGNRTLDAAFYFYQANLILDGGAFENNSIRSWISNYSEGDGGILDGAGKTLDEAGLAERYGTQKKSQPTEEQTEVHVSTVDELIAAIAPNTAIILDEKVYDLSTATGYGTDSGEYYYWEDIYDGPGLVITGVDNLTIRSVDGNRTLHFLEAVPRYANVLTFNGCTNICVSGFTAGHTEEPGYCTGGVFRFQDCDAVLAANCGMYGCGTLGVSAENCGDVTVSNCEIYECSQGGISMYNVKGATIEKCTFRDLGGDELSFYGCTDVSVDGTEVDGNSFQ